MENKIIKKFKKSVDKLSKKFKSTINLFGYLHASSYTRIEIMIIDSVVKNMSMDNLHNTLLLPKQNYYLLLQNLTTKINSNIKTIKNQ